jgi:demethylmenaquinone methyltransferase/2-methoxy-6-polyprenyl-1,4-benzoquinol methylase
MGFQSFRTAAIAWPIAPGSVRWVHVNEKAYYERRAPEYDDWWLGTGLFASRDRPGWHDEVEALGAAVSALPACRVLDVACGTGFLTRRLRGDITALDQSDAMLAIAAGRVPGARLVRADIPPLPFADDSFDRVFTSHFYGHLEDPAEFLAEARRVAAELVVVDSAGPDREEVQRRKLNDGSEHEVYKRWFRGATLATEIGGEVLFEGDWFVAVRASRDHRQRD